MLICGQLVLLFVVVWGLVVLLVLVVLMVLVL